MTALSFPPEHCAQGAPVDAFDRTRLVALGITSRITARRWARGAPRAPRWAELLARILRGEIGPIHPAWRHWGISARGELVSPEGWSFRPGEILAARLQWGRVSGAEWMHWFYAPGALEALPPPSNEALACRQPPAQLEPAPSLDRARARSPRSARPESPPPAARPLAAPPPAAHPPVAHPPVAGNPAG